MFQGEKTTGVIFSNSNIFIYLTLETALNHLMCQGVDGKLIPDPGMRPGFMCSRFRSSFYREKHVSWENLSHRYQTCLSGCD